MPKRTNPFQQLATSISKALHDAHVRVEESMMIKDHDADTLTEVDILVSFEQGGHEYRVGIECRDHARPAGPTWIRDLAGKRDACRLDKIIAVHSKGFSTSALRAAQVKRVLALSLREVSEAVLSELLPHELMIQLINFSLKGGWIELIGDPSDAVLLEHPRVITAQGRELAVDDVGRHVCSFLQADWSRKRGVPENKQECTEEHRLFEFHLECEPGTKMQVAGVTVPLKWIRGLGQITECWKKLSSKKYSFGDIPVITGTTSVLGHELRLTVASHKNEKKLAMEGVMAAPSGIGNLPFTNMVQYRVFNQDEKSTLYPEAVSLQRDE